MRTGTRTAIATALTMMVIVPGWTGGQEPSKPATAPGSTVFASGDAQRSESETRQKLEQLACGPEGVHLKHHTEKDLQPAPEAQAEKGLVFVIRTANMIGAALPAKMAMDGKWVGVNRLSNYFYLEVEPGPHYFCTDANTRGLLSLVIDAGKTYYIEQKLTMGGTDLNVLDSEKGRQYVEKYHRSTFEAKEKK